MKISCSFLVILISVISFAQTAPDIQWQKCFGGSEHDYFRSIKKPLIMDIYLHVPPDRATATYQQIMG